MQGTPIQLRDLKYRSHFWVGKSPMMAWLSIDSRLASLKIHKVSSLSTFEIEDGQLSAYSVNLLWYSSWDEKNIRFSSDCYGQGLVVSSNNCCFVKSTIFIVMSLTPKVQYSWCSNPLSVLLSVGCLLSLPTFLPTSSLPWSAGSYVPALPSIRFKMYTPTLCCYSFVSRSSSSGSSSSSSSRTLALAWRRTRPLEPSGVDFMHAYLTSCKVSSFELTRTNR